MVRFTSAQLKAIFLLAAFGTFYPCSGQDQQSSAGLTLYESGDHRQAVVTLRKEVRAQPTSARLWSRLGLSFLKTEEVKDGMKALSRAIELDPNDPYSHIGVGYGSLMQGRISDAYRAAERVIKIDPTLAEGYYILANCSFQRGAYDVTHERLTKAIEVNPRFPDAYLLRGQTLVINMLQQVGAIEKTANPNHELLRDAEQDLAEYIRLEPAKSKTNGAVKYHASIKFFYDFAKANSKRFASMLRGVADEDASIVPARVKSIRGVSIKQVPKYASWSGSVRLLLGISAEGKAEHVLVIQGAPHGLGELTVEAFRKAKYSPATKNGRPIPYMQIVQWNFDIHSTGFPR